jgi:hypothetical protein
VPKFWIEITFSKRKLQSCSREELKAIVDARTSEVIALFQAFQIKNRIKKKKKSCSVQEINRYAPVKLKACLVLPRAHIRRTPSSSLDDSCSNFQPN